MMPPKPTLIIIPLPTSLSNDVRDTKLERSPVSSAHVLTFCSLLLNMRIYSSSIRVVKQFGLATPQHCPVFGNGDKIEGKVTLDPSCSQNGYLTISLEGVFEYSSVTDDTDAECAHDPIVRKDQHVFLSSSAAIPLSPTPESRSAIREALNIRRRPSTLSLNGPTGRSCEFSFELPQGSLFGEQMPLTFSPPTIPWGERRWSDMEEFTIAYRITAVWEACDGSGNQAILEAPIFFQPDTDFQSIDISFLEPQLWLEMPLISERPIPFKCAVTLPRPQSFSRCSSIPYFVVFTTRTGSACLVKEIAADATVVLSLVRKIALSSQPNSRSPTLPDTSPVSDESDIHVPLFASHSRLLRRSTMPTRSHTREESFSTSIPMCKHPQEGFSASRTLQTQVSIGFPKRPRTNDVSQNLPDGLYKGKVELSQDMLPSVNWPGISVKYYLDVSVLVGQDSVRACVPIRVH